MKQHLNFVSFFITISQKNLKNFEYIDIRHLKMKQSSKLGSNRIVRMSVGLIILLNTTASVIQILEKRCSSSVLCGIRSSMFVKISFHVDTAMKLFSNYFHFI
ncbi:hypothetical protein HHI36_000084 [Cryptolaemus montrouzieri]|uniref:Uncharacterized protein n=1 Tax=Cryptolaemus montrouzieri TaxID=559131 RepID=A0ABD2P3S2_9CUCU